MLVFTAKYIAREHTFYSSDWSNYHNTTADVARHYSERFRESPTGAMAQLIRETWRSTYYDYNLIHTLAIAPLLVLFGTSRIAYISSIAIVYLLPFALTIGAIARRLVPSHGILAFWSAVLLALLTPAVEVPTLRGYPDAGAAALLTLAMYVYIEHRSSRSYRYMTLIGVIIAIAVLFRRHFIYPGTALIATLAVDALIRAVIYRKPHSSRRIDYWVRIGGQLAVVIGGVGIAFILFGAPFVYRLLTTDFSSLYASWERPTLHIIRGFAGWYGWAAWIVATIGFAVGWMTRTVAKPVTWLIVLWSAFSVMLWAVEARQVGIQYELQFAPFVVLGIVALAWSVWSTWRGLGRALALTGLGGYILANAAVGLAAMSLPPYTPLRPLLSATSEPLVLKEYDDVVGIVDWLRSITTPNRGILIAAPTIVDEGLLAAAEHAMYGPAAFLVLLSQPAVDSSDPYPLDVLAAADYVVVASPPPTTVDQAVQRVVMDAFAESWEIASDFKPLPTQFVTADGVYLKIYERWRLTSPETALATLARMHSAIGTRPGGQGDWIILAHAPAHWNYRERYNRYEFWNDAGAGDPSTVFVYLPRSRNEYEAVGRVEYSGGSCVRPALERLTVRADHSSTDRTPVNVDEDGHFTLRLTPGTEDGPYTLLSVVGAGEPNQPAGYCTLRIELSRPPARGNSIANAVERAVDYLRDRPR
ncbi:MAG TPA: hypothetical protein VK066_32010 [Chloroflexota bacterium]|nr:hypothetical protein [Chloroflexota bacterium]